MRGDAITSTDEKTSGNTKKIKNKKSLKSHLTRLLVGWMLMLVNCFMNT